MITTLIVTKICPLCKESASVEMPIDSYRKWHEEGVSIQVAWPDVTPEQREMAISGTHPRCWSDFWGADE